MSALPPLSGSADPRLARQRHCVVVIVVGRGAEIATERSGHHCRIVGVAGDDMPTSVSRASARGGRMMAYTARNMIEHRNPCRRHNGCIQRLLTFLWMDDVAR